MSVSVTLFLLHWPDMNEPYIYLGPQTLRTETSVWFWWLQAIIFWLIPGSCISVWFHFHVRPDNEPKSEFHRNCSCHYLGDHIHRSNRLMRIDLNQEEPQSLELAYCIGLHQYVNVLSPYVSLILLGFRSLIYKFCIRFFRRLIWTGMSFEDMGPDTFPLTHRKPQHVVNII